MFHFVRRFDYTNQLIHFLDKTLSFVELSISAATQTHNLVIESGSQSVFELMTTRSKNQYCPSVNHNRSVFMLAFSDLPANYMQEFSQMRVFGSASTLDYSTFADPPTRCWTYKHTAAPSKQTFDVYCTLLYDTESLEIYKRYAKSISHL